MITDAPESAVVVRGFAFPVRIEAVEQGELEERLNRVRRGSWLLLIRAVLDDEMAARFEDAGVGYVDPSGRWWVPGVERTSRSLTLQATARRSLRAPSLRLSQLLADHPDQSWTERNLAKRGDTTPTTAHRLLARLERDGFVKAQGQGRGASRRVRDVEGLRSWLAREGRPGRGRSLSCFVPDPRSIPARAAGCALALTGAVAAERIGFPVRTGAGLPLVRVGGEDDAFEAVPGALGGFRTERGANMILIADPQRLALTDATRLEGGGLVAPPSRIMLDLYLEPRGEAAVDVFLSLWGSRTIAV
ncbi:MAG TPA: hypothetical protein VN758_10410 [Solirubrobacterales bacterium]|nr:hypothetical protein [Solirubrobacterales bacterium]